jgi:hypothetical protein
VVRPVTVLCLTWSGLTDMPSLYFHATFDFFSAMYFLIARRLFCLLRLCEFLRASCFMLILLVRRGNPAGCLRMRIPHGERLGTHGGLKSWWLARPSPGRRFLISRISPLLEGCMETKRAARNPSGFVCRFSGRIIFGRPLGRNRPEIHGAPISFKRLLRFPTAHVEGVRDYTGSRL